jgi:hypothetical protein
MKIFKVFVLADNTQPYIIEMIEHEGVFWLVTDWIDMPLEGVTKPKRIIRVETDNLIKLGPPYEADYALKTAIPKAILDCEPVPSGAHGFVVRDLPDISLPLGTKGIH